MRTSLSLFSMLRYTQLPYTLYRIQPRLAVRLHTYDDQVAKGLTSFDLKLRDGLVQPIPRDSSYATPNGMSLRPVGNTLETSVRALKSETDIYRIEQGLILPDKLCVYLEHGDHHSLQTTEAVSLETFNARLTEFLESLPPPMTVSQFIEMIEDEDSFDN